MIVGDLARPEEGIGGPRLSGAQQVVQALWNYDVGEA